jgi:FAD/FMN-containing dehydrogenase
MRQAADWLRQQQASVIYGTVRLIEPDRETLIPWAREAYACIIFNLHTEHDPDSLAHTAKSFRGLIDRALALGGSFYLTYHRFATREHVLAAYPAMPDFLAEKARRDPQGLLQSDWYRAMKRLIEGE